MEVKIIGGSIPNIPWEKKPEDINRPVWRYSENPIIGWNKYKEAARIYNSAAAYHEGRFVGVFRVEAMDGKPQLHFGSSPDGINWDIEEKDIQWVDEDGRSWIPQYSYDPRLIKIEDTWYIVWCTDFGGPTLAMGRTKDFKTFVRMENACLPFNRNGVLFPRKINGKYYLLSRPSDGGHTPFGDIFISESPDLRYWGVHRRVMTKGNIGWWQMMKIGAGSVPIETSIGWLLFYHGVVNTCNGYVYSIGAVILDRDDPSKVKYRCSNYLLTPEKEYETSGFVPNVCFPCAALADPDTGRIAIYYGAADTYSALAFCEINELCEYIVDHNELNPGDDIEYR